MRQVKAKKLKRKLVNQMQGEITKKERKLVYQTKKFKSIYRRAKKNRVSA